MFGCDDARSCSGEGVGARGWLATTGCCILNVAGLHLWASFVLWVVVAHCAIIMFAFMILASLCMCVYVSRRICVWRLVLLLCVLLPVFCVPCPGGVAGRKYIVCHMFRLAIGVWRLRCVFVVEWICLVVMTRDLVLVKGPSGAGSLPPDAVS